MAEDLRHETTHGFLHAVVRNLPLWLDEGLAEYWEVPRSCRGLNKPHVERISSPLRRGAWRPDLRRLEGLNPAGDMNQDDYAESWAWVHFLLESRPELASVLRGYLADLRCDSSAEPHFVTSAAGGRTAGAGIVEHVRSLTPAGP